MYYNNNDLPYLPDIESGFVELVRKISEWDVSVFAYNRKKETTYNGIKITVSDDLIVLNSKIDLPGDHEYSREWVTQIRNQYTNTYYALFDFNKNGSLVGYKIVTESMFTIHSVVLGNKKLLVDNEKWISRDDFHSNAFQYSITNKRETFDIFFISGILRMFGE